MRLQFNLTMPPAALALSSQAAADLGKRFRRLKLEVLGEVMEGAREILLRESARREAGAPEGGLLLHIPVERLSGREIASAARLFRRVAEHLAGAGHRSPLFDRLAASFERGPALRKAWNN